MFNKLKTLKSSKFTLYILVVCISLSLSGCFGKPKNFTIENLTITLTIDFSERKNPDFDLYLACDDVVFSAKRETTSDLEAHGYEIKSLKDYGAELLAQNHIPASALMSKNNYYYFINSETVSGAQYTYIHFMFEDNKDYWMCNFVCKSKDYSRLKKNIFQWADTIKFSN